MYTDTVIVIHWETCAELMAEMHPCYAFNDKNSNSNTAPNMNQKLNLFLFYSISFSDFLHYKEKTTISTFSSSEMTTVCKQEILELSETE